MKDFKVNDKSMNLLLAAGGSENLNPKLLLDAYALNSNNELPLYSVVRTNLYDLNMCEYK